MTSVAVRTATVTVRGAGLQTTVQELPGRVGLWHVGVPPSGPMDDLAAGLANLAVGNAHGAALLECVVVGPVLSFSARTLVCVTGAASAATLDGRRVQPGVVAVAAPGAVLDVGPLPGPGMRAYVAVGGGIDVPVVLGSRATFLLGELGGVDGRALAPGDVLALGRTENGGPPLDVAPLLPVLLDTWEVRVVPGPHGAPEHLTPAGTEELFAADWTVDHRVDRTGVRLVGPRPGWARSDGGDAGLHPSNVHDSAYPVGGVMLSGDTPVVVGPDGPSLGGFVVACVVVEADRWVLGQLRPGDRLRLVPVTPAQADEARLARATLLAAPRDAVAAVLEADLVGAPAASPARAHRVDRPEALAVVEDVTVRLAGDAHVLVEIGPPVLDLAVRVRVHLLAEALRAAAPDGVAELVEGVRSMLVKVDPELLAPLRLADLLARLVAGLPDPRSVVLPVREVLLPVCLDHPEAHEAMARYTRTVRPDAPWCPDNVEFIRRVNDLAGRDDVFHVLTSATYLVLGLGDVYLGAPVAVPLDPRHRLVTTKYDPARTWTPQNAVGIGGVYLCVYGMEGPGGYQLVGRTVPVWRHLPGRDELPWLLRPFDRLRFVPVDADELARLRADVHAGRIDLVTRPATFSLAEVDELERRHAQEIETFRTRRTAAFVAERKRWGR